MREDKKEILTKEKIEIDIKKKYKWQTKEYAFVSILLLLYSILFFSYVEFKWEFWYIFFIIISLVVVFLNIVSVYFLFINLQVLISNEMNYSICVDRYKGTSNKRIGKYVIPCMDFEKYGRFELHNREQYYSWSKLFMVDNRGLKRSSHIDDLFYVILIRNKIVYIYNRDFFDLK